VIFDFSPPSSSDAYIHLAGEDETGRGFYSGEDAHWGRCQGTAERKPLLCDMTCRDTEGAAMDRCDRHMCPIAEICSDSADKLALSVLRYVAAGYLTSDVACMEAAYEAAEQMLGPVEGADFVASMTGIVRALRRERQGEWRFMPATCCRATVDECDLIELISCARRAGEADLRSKAGIVTGGRPASCLCASVAAAAKRLNTLQLRYLPDGSPASSPTVH